ncbi:MAG: ATP-grasp domain-containing protein [Gemmataceae bacterium]
MMQQAPHLLILGGSTRAAACSALRAGMQPWCAGYFADADLAERCPARCVTGKDYPHGLLAALDEAPEAPWLYTGALENRPPLIRQLAKRRPLWGIDGQALAKTRAPLVWSRMLRDAGLPAPAVSLRATDLDAQRDWMIKPLKSGGGARVRRFKGKPAGRGMFYQEYIAGELCSSLYVGDGHGASLLGSTRQLVGIDWLHGPGFKYCGSIGPLTLDSGAQRTLEQMGNVLAAGCGLRGIFGIDFVLRQGVPWPIEINPRYTASVEVLEHALGIAVLALQRAVCKNGLRLESAGQSINHARQGRSKEPEYIVGKAILYAALPVVFPEDGPWRQVVDRVPPVEHLAEYADIPHAGESIFPARPILTCFAKGSTHAEVMQALEERARRLDLQLHDRAGMFSMGR